MTQLDRLSSLVSHFEVHADAPDTDAHPNLVISDQDGSPKNLWLAFSQKSPPTDPANWSASASLDFGAQANPVLEALPEEIEIDLAQAPELAAIANLIASEINLPRCGGQIALDRLCEFLLITVLRREVELRKSDTGVLSGLADPNLSPVLVAIHDKPGNQWRLDDFVDLSGMSRSQFMDLFQRVIGKSPMAYLKQWRMTLARNALLKGERVKETARRFGYGSGDAFTRAFTATFGVAPTTLNRPLRDTPQP